MIGKFKKNISSEPLFFIFNKKSPAIRQGSENELKNTINP